MITNPGVVHVYAAKKRKHPIKHLKEQSTGNQKNTKCKMSVNEEPVCIFSLSGGEVRPPAPVSYATVNSVTMSENIDY